MKVATLLVLGCGMVPAAGQTGPKPQAYKGLEITVSGVERASSASLNDCPPGANTVKGMAKPGEQFALVSVAFKVLPDFKDTPLKRPVLYDVNGTAYNTAMSFVDVGKTPAFTCNFAFRVPEDAKLKRFQIETVSFDLEGKP
jgi:hypothetical protein